MCRVCTFMTGIGASSHRRFDSLALEEGAARRANVGTVSVLSTYVHTCARQSRFALHSAQYDVQTSLLVCRFSRATGYSASYVTPCLR